MRKCGNLAMCKCGNVEIWRCANAEIWQCGNLKIWQCENLEIWQCKNAEIRQCGNLAMWKCGNLAMCRCGNLAVWNLSALKQGCQLRRLLYFREAVCLLFQSTLTFYRVNNPDGSLLVVGYSRGLLPNCYGSCPVYVCSVRKV